MASNLIHPSDYHNNIFNTVFLSIVVFHLPVFTIINILTTNGFYLIHPSDYHNNIFNTVFMTTSEITTSVSIITYLIFTTPSQNPYLQLTPKFTYIPLVIRG